MNFIKKLFLSNKKKKKLISTILKNPSEIPLLESVLNYLKMETTGALLVTGNWGSGKTYHIKNYIFPSIEEETEFTPIIVSLFGETNRENISKKVLFSYFDKKGDKVKLGTRDIVKNLSNLSKAVPIVNKYVNLDKLIFGVNENALRLIPHDKLLICFDDIERMGEEIKVDDFLGVVNDLVENKGCKVILIANKIEFKNKSNYEEKTIEKTIQFLPDIKTIFNNLIKDYKENDFQNYLQDNKEFLIQTLSVNEETNDEYKEELKKAFSNIRILKFAIEHFKIVYQILTKNGESDLINIQLKYLWVFIQAISIEFRKPGSIDYFKRKNLDNGRAGLVMDILERAKPLRISNTEKGENQEQENEWTFSKTFIKKYFDRLSMKYIYFPQVYDLITADKSIIIESFIDSLKNKFEFEKNIYSGHKILDEFHNHLYEQSEKQFKNNLLDLFDYCKKGELMDIMSYLYAETYFNNFKNILDVDEPSINQSVKEGIDDFFKGENFNEENKNQLYFLNEKKTDYNKELIEYAVNKFYELDKRQETELIQKLEDLLEKGIKDFVDYIFPKQGTTKTMADPLLDRLDKEKFKKGFQKAEPKDFYRFFQLIEFRYLENPHVRHLLDENKFLEEIQEIIESNMPSKKTLSFQFIQENLIPMIEKAKEKFKKLKGE